MSGIAIAASTMPGSVATFWSCSSDLSVRIAASSSASANTRAGTRMSSRAVAGISQRVSSIRTGSDIEHDVPAPAGRLALLLLEQLAQRVDGLTEDRRLAAPVQLQLQLGGVLDPAVTRLHA